MLQNSNWKYFSKIIKNGRYNIVVHAFDVQNSPRTFMIHNVIVLIATPLTEYERENMWRMK